MSTALLLPVEAVPEPLRKKRFTREEVDRLLEIGFFEGQRCELIDGELIDKTGQKPQHASAIQLALAWLVSILDAHLIQVQLPIEVSAADRERSLPEPDLAVLAESKPDFDKRHPRGDELLLVIEVSDTTAYLDLSRKAALCGAARIPEYWVLDLPRRLLVVHREPFESGYRLIRLFTKSDTVSLENCSESVRVSDLLPAE
jgi:Uma2 family endonuclease